MKKMKMNERKGNRGRVVSGNMCEMMSWVKKSKSAAGGFQRVDELGAKRFSGLIEARASVSVFL